MSKNSDIRKLRAYYEADGWEFIKHFKGTMGKAENAQFTIVVKNPSGKIVGGHYASFAEAFAGISQFLQMEQTMKLDFWGNFWHKAAWFPFWLFGTLLLVANVWASTEADPRKVAGVWAFNTIAAWLAGYTVGAKK